MTTYRFDPLEIDDPAWDTIARLYGLAWWIRQGVREMRGRYRTHHRFPETLSRVCRALAPRPGTTVTVLTAAYPSGRPATVRAISASGLTLNVGPVPVFIGWADLLSGQAALRGEAARRLCIRIAHWQYSPSRDRTRRGA
jgi:hypothetical protein